MQQLLDIVNALKFLKANTPEAQATLNKGIEILESLTTEDDKNTALDRLTNNHIGNTNYVVTDPTYTESFLYLMDALYYSQLRAAVKDTDDAKGMVDAYKTNEAESLQKMIALIQAYGKNLRI